MRWRIPLLVSIAIVGIIALTVRSNPFNYCGYCQHQYMEEWKPGNTYPCSYWRYVFTQNSSDISLYMNTPGG